ncbi:hypothetical protein LJC37_04620, partial [Bacteroidales bacterium OttesenSCG-928-E04]|nr:hypothetical protein [Bacteroidales bacterium OttesenSCG-928-E04]
SSAKFFSMFKNNSHGLDYLLIPANTLEKTVTGIILSQVYKVILYFIALALGIKFGSFLYSLHHTNIDGVLSIKELFTWVPDNLNFIFTFFTVQAFFLFASVFFKKNAFLKTIMFYFAYCVVLVFILFSIVFILENHTGLIKEAAYAANPFTFFNFTYENMTIFGKISTVVWSCIALLFPWVMSYLRLREKEV